MGAAPSPRRELGGCAVQPVLPAQQLSATAAARGG
eukprot:gene17814-18496_t